MTPTTADPVVYVYQSGVLHWTVVLFLVVVVGAIVALSMYAWLRPERWQDRVRRRGPYQKSGGGL